MIREPASGSDKRGLRVDKKTGDVLAQGFRHKLRLCFSDKSGQKKESEFVLLDVRVMTAKAFRRLDAHDQAPDPKDGLARQRWSSADLDGGMVLAVRAEDRSRESHSEDMSFPERAEAIRKIRSLVLDAIDKAPVPYSHVKCVRSYAVGVILYRG